MHALPAQQGAAPRQKGRDGCASCGCLPCSVMLPAPPGLWHGLPLLSAFVRSVQRATMLLASFNRRRSHGGYPQPSQHPWSPSPPPTPCRKCARGWRASSSAAESGRACTATGCRCAPVVLAPASSAALSAAPGCPPPRAVPGNLLCMPSIPVPRLGDLLRPGVLNWRPTLWVNTFCYSVLLKYGNHAGRGARRPQQDPPAQVRGAHVRPARPLPLPACLPA